MKKAQIWYLDFIFGLSIFVLLLFVAFNFIFKESSSSDSELKKEAAKVSNYLVSEGLPKNWTLDNVNIIGLTNENEIDIEKIERFSNLSINYTLLKGIFGIKNDFLIFFEDNEGNILNFAGINFTYFGYPNMTEQSILNISKNTYTIVRYLIYRHGVAEIVQMKLIMFQK